MSEDDASVSLTATPLSKQSDFSGLRCVLQIVRDEDPLLAAKQLGVNRFAMLRRIKAFESWFGAPLFRRTSEGLRPTDQAVLLLERVGGPLQAIDEEIRRLKLGNRGISDDMVG